MVIMGHKYPRGFLYLTLPVLKEIQYLTWMTPNWVSVRGKEATISIQYIVEQINTVCGGGDHQGFRWVKH